MAKTSKFKPMLKRVQ